MKPTTSAYDLEGFLALIYVDEAALARFLTNPEREARDAGLSEQDVQALRALDHDQLRLAAHGFSHKRARARRPAWWTRFRKRAM